MGLLNGKSIRSRLTYANVVATLALFLALGGGAVWAAGKIGSKEIKSGAITNAKLANGAVTGAKVKSGSLTGKQIKASTLGNVPSATSAGELGGNPLSAVAAVGAAQTSSGVADAATGAGNTTPLADVDDLTFSVQCQDMGSGNYKATLLVKSDVSGLISFPTGSHALTGGDPATSLISASGTGATGFSGDFYFAASESDTSLGVLHVTGIYGLAVHTGTSDGDCNAAVSIFREGGLTTVAPN